jgi:Ribonuclease G/E
LKNFGGKIAKIKITVAEVVPKLKAGAIIRSNAERRSEAKILYIRMESLSLRRHQSLQLFLY